MARKQAARRGGDPTTPGVWRRPRPLAAVVTVATVLLAALAVRGLVGDTRAVARGADDARDAASHRAPPADPNAVGPQHDVMAIVNGQDVSRTTLAEACVERHGERVLESLVNKRLIDHHCRNRGVSVTEEEIDAEVDRMAKRFKLGREQWLELLKNQRGVDEVEYKRDILWPTLALRELAADSVQPTDKELRNAYETQFGAAVSVRLISMSDEQKARQAQREAAARPDEFARLAMQLSEDVNSASIGGLIQPIRPHSAEPAVERVAFTLEPGQVSDVIHVGQQWAILKCEGRVPPREVPLADVRAELEDAVKEEKLRGVANTLFNELQGSATVQNVYNDPKLRETMPGVVATVNGEPVTMKELGAECLLRHGEETLLVEVSHLLLRQELKSAGITVTQEELEDEMRHAAELSGVVSPDGKADLARWIETATREQDVSYELYVKDSVWPSAALKKLTAGRVEVSQEDLDKGFQANYGERVRCRAIVLGDLRRAQEVWDKARQNDSMEFFGQLAEEYSIEPTSKSLRGETPPVRRFGGQPQIEQAAFALAEGELSGITQVGDKFVILKCEGRTDPVKVDPSEVREILTADLLEKKSRIAMSEEFDRIRSKARIDNYLAGTSQAPAKPAQQASRVEDSAVQPTSAVR